MTKDLITECAVCKDWKDPKTLILETPYKPHFYTPTVEQRREYHFRGGKISHGYCPTCYILQLKQEGYEGEELEILVREAFEDSVEKGERSQNN